MIFGEQIATIFAENPCMICVKMSSKNNMLYLIINTIRIKKNKNELCYNVASVHYKCMKEKRT